MSGWSIRARLTATLTVITLVVAAAAVAVGLRLLEQRVIDDELQEREAIALAAAEGSFTSGGVAEAIDSGAVLTLDDDGVAFVEEVVFDETPIAFAIAEGLGITADLVREFGDGEAFTVRSNDGNYATLADGQISVSTEPPTGDAVPVSINDLFDLGFVDGGDAGDSPRYVFGRTTTADGPIGLVAEVSDRIDALDVVGDVLVVAVGVLTALAAVATWLITGRALRPVTAMTDRVGTITAGNLSDRVPESSRDDEIGRLARTMNSMLGRIETADLRRRQFVSDASHELRTPVAVLRSEAEAAERAPDATTVARMADVVGRESERLGTIVEDLLALARADEPVAPREPVHRRVVDLDEIVLAEARRARAVEVDRSAVSAGRIAGEAEEIRRLVAHLLDNAARHADSTVSVGVETTHHAVRLVVDDDGAGIPVADRKRVFERFVRLDEARARDRGGAGLGLAVVDASVRALGGTIDIDDAPSGGARFVIEFPPAD